MSEAATRPDLSDAEIDGICEGYTQSAAKIRHLRSLGLKVDRRPNGRPLVARMEWERIFGATAKSPQAAGTGPKWRVAA